MLHIANARMDKTAAIDGRKTGILNKIFKRSERKMDEINIDGKEVQ